MPNEGKIEIPEYVKKWYHALGVEKLPEFLKPVFVVPLPVAPEWTTGYLKIIEIEATAGNAGTTVHPPTGKRWKVLYLWLTIVCDATVANRYFRMELVKDDLSTIIAPLGGNQTAITASQTKSVGIHQFILDEDWFFGDFTATKISTTSAHNMLMKDDMYILMRVSGGVAGDSFSGRITVLESDEYGQVAS